MIKLVDPIKHCSEVMPVISQKEAMMMRTMMIMRTRTTMTRKRKRTKLKKHERKCLPRRMVPHAHLGERILIETLTVKAEAMVKATTIMPLTLQPFIRFKNQSQSQR